MTTNSLKRLGGILPIISIFLGLILLLSDPLPLQVLRNNLFDQYQRWYPRNYTDVPVRIIDIDETSLSKLGQWPWPRTRIAELIEKLNDAQVAAIGFDIIFAEPDRTSPKIIADFWELESGLRNELKKLPDHDTVLANSINKADSVVLGFAGAQHTEEKKQSKKNLSSLSLTFTPYRYINIGRSPKKWLHTFDTAIPILPQLIREAKGVGSLNFIPDSDGIVRRVPLVLQISDELIPSLISETLRVAQGEQNYVLKSEEQNFGLKEIQIGEFVIPSTAQGEIWIHYSQTNANRYLPAWEIISEKIPNTLLEGHIVLIGSSAQGLMDLRFSPLGQIIPGVEIHAQALEQILSNHTIERPSWAKSVEIISVIVIGLLVGYLSIKNRILVSSGLTLIVIVIIFAIGWFSFKKYGFLINTPIIIVICILTFIIGSLIHHFISEREHRWIKKAFSRYVSPNRVNYLVEHPETMQLGGALQECSFIFTDLANFTKLMESIDPREAVSLLNTYLDKMIGIAFRYDGTLDRIIGDAVAILFSAPIKQIDHAERALSCALEMDTFANNYMKELNTKGVHFGKTRIGVHSGEVVVGNFGGSTIFDYRALGDPINTASRLETFNKIAGTNICISETTLEKCPHAIVRPIGQIRLKGKQKILKVFEPISKYKIEKYAPLDIYLKAYDLMVKNHPSAENIFRDLNIRFPDDPLVTLHFKRLNAATKLDKKGDLILDRRK